MVHRINMRIRLSDTLGRWGGEEFLLLLPETLPEAALELAEELRRGIEEAPFCGDIRVTCSFGLAQYQPEETMQMLIERADNALYRAKRLGRNRVETAEDTDRN